MLIKVIKKQTIFLLKQKEASLTFILLLAVVLGNYITSVLTFRGTDVSQMYQLFYNYRRSFSIYPI